VRTIAASPRCLAAVTVLVLAWALWDRVWALGRWPGINGDEAWYAVQLLRMEQGAAIPRTPTGNLPGPLHLALLWSALAVLPRELWVLRVPSVVTSVAAMAVTYVALRRHFGNETARVGLLLQACLPVGIVYARLGWDTSHGPLLGALMAWAALERRWLLLPPLVAFALWNHPTNVFVVPFLAGIILATADASASLAQAARRVVPPMIALAAALPVLVLTSSAASVVTPSQWVERALSWQHWARFAAALGDFLAGAAPFAYTAGPPLARPGTIAGWLVLAMATAIAVAGGRAAIRSSRAFSGMLAGLIGTLAGFAIVAGTRALEPHSERYAMVLVTPVVLCAAVLLGRLSTRPLASRTGLVLSLAIGIIALGHTHVGYFRELALTGSTSHRTFWTGDIEPKAAAWQSIRDEIERRSTRTPVRVIAEDWWTLQPLLYLAHGTPGVTVRRLHGGERLRPGETAFLVGFPGGPAGKLRRALAADTQQVRWSIPGTARAEVLEVVQVEKRERRSR